MTFAWQNEPSVVKVEGGCDFLISHQLEYAQRSLGDHDFQSFDALEDANGLEAALWAAPLFAPDRLLVVRRANKMKKSDALVTYCERPHAGTVLVLIPEGRQAKWYKSLKHNEVLECVSPKPWELADWLVKWSSRKGYILSKSFAEAVVQNVGSDLWALTGEMVKVFHYMEPGQKQVSASDITSVLVQHEHLKPWLILGAWGQKKFDQADRLLTLYLHQTQDPWSLLSVIALFLNHTEHLITYLSARSASVGVSEIQTLLGLSARAFQDLESHAGAWGLSEVKRAYNELCRIEVSAKTGEDAATLLHLFMHSHLDEKVTR